jgi:putative DNA primase/helicase
MIDDAIDVCSKCGDLPSRLAILDGGNWRLRCSCGDRVVHVIGESSEVAEPDPKLTAEEIATRAFIRKTLDASQPARGTLAERYLRSRGIDSVPEVLRFVSALPHTLSGSRLPAMLAPVVNIVGEVTGLHRTYLDSTGDRKASVEPNRMMLGRCVGAAVHLAEAREELGISEGIESGLAAMDLRGIPIWAALSTAGLAALALPPLPIASKVTIFADNDDAGISAAKKAAARWHAEGRRISIERPRKLGTDFNDLLLARKCA